MAIKGTLSLTKLQWTLTSKHFLKNDPQIDLVSSV